MRIAAALAGALAAPAALALAACHSHAAVERLEGPEIVVVVPDPGASVSELESRVAVPLEVAINGMPHLVHLRTVLVPGLAQIAVELAPGTDVFAARQAVLTRIEAVHLAAGVIPTLAPDTSRGAILRYTLSGHDRVALRTFQEGQVRPALLRVPGVSEVAACGGRGERLVVAAFGARAAAHGMATRELINALSATDADPAHHQVPQLPVPLDDIANVRREEAPPTCQAFDQTGAEIVVGTVYARGDADPLEVRKRVEAALVFEQNHDGVTLAVWPRARPEALSVDLTDDQLSALRSAAPMLVEYGPAEDAPPIAPGTAALHTPQAAAPALVTQLRAAHLLVHDRDELIVELRGADLTALERAAHDVEVRLGAHANGRIGTRYVPTVRTALDPRTGARLGIMDSDAANAVRATSPAGYEVGSLVDETRIPIVLVTSDGYLRGYGDRMTPLTAVATTAQTAEPADLHREDGSRWIGVRALGDADELHAALAELPLPPGYEWKLISDAR